VIKKTNKEQLKAQKNNTGNSYEGNDPQYTPLATNRHHDSSNVTLPSSCLDLISPVHVTP